MLTVCQFRAGPDYFLDSIVDQLLHLLHEHLDVQELESRVEPDQLHKNEEPPVLDFHPLIKDVDERKHRHQIYAEPAFKIYFC